jgi:hypothetical protein
MSATSRIVLFALAVCALSAAPAHAVVPFQTITSSGPLPNIWIGNEGGCQVSHTGDSSNELFPPSTTPGDCGTLVWNGTTLFAPDFTNHGGSAASSIGPNTGWTPVSQSGVTGAGTQASPFAITTVFDAGGGGLRVTEVDSYVVGAEYYRTDVTLQNTGGAPSNGIVYRAGDCYLQSNDQGYGFVEAANNGPGCSVNANNSPAGRIEQWVPLTAGSNFMEDGYSTVWAAIGSHNPFPNTCKCDQLFDNGAGLSWPYSLGPGATATFSQLTVFSPTGVTGGQATQPQPTPTPAPTATTTRLPVGSSVLPLPSNRRCTSRRAFPIRIRKYPGIRYSFAVVLVNGRRVPVYVYTERRVRVTRIGAVYLNSTRRFRAFVDLRGLARGTYSVQVRAATTDLQVRRNTRKYRTCSRRLGGTIPRL